MSSSPFRIGMFGGVSCDEILELEFRFITLDASHLSCHICIMLLRAQGTVGGGVYELLKNHALTFPHSRSIVIQKICVRSLDKPRDFNINDGDCELVTDPDSILKDDEIDCVVEVMGGTTVAKTVVMEALAQKKAVVTANKALLAAHLDEIVAAAGATLIGMEAAVCGGIPIIHALQTCYAGDTIRSVSGIMNGTTNYMLCKMEEGAGYDDVLKEAQQLGFAEADPTADVEGHDVGCQRCWQYNMNTSFSLLRLCRMQVRAKIAILAKLAFGQTVPESQISCKGISQLALADIDFSKSNYSTIKLVGTAACADGKLSVRVTPVMVSNSHFLATARGAGNAVVVDSINMNLTTYGGPGAGRFPTANSIVADILRVAAGTTGPLFPKQTTNLVVDKDYESTFYIRISTTKDVLQQVREAAERQKVGIESVSTVGALSVVVVTKSCLASRIEALCEDLLQGDLCDSDPVFMPIVT
jgi:homoserine dehydrogenase